MMVCVTVPLVLPQSSASSTRRSDELVFPQVPAVVVAPRSCTVAPPHVSVAVGAVKVGEAGHSTVPLLPCPEIKGTVLYSTHMAILSVALGLPQTTVAFQLFADKSVLPHV